MYVGDKNFTLKNITIKAWDEAQERSFNTHAVNRFIYSIALSTLATLNAFYLTARGITVLTATLLKVPFEYAPFIQEWELTRFLPQKLGWKAFCAIEHQAATFAFEIIWLPILATVNPKLAIKWHQEALPTYISKKRELEWSQKLANFTQYIHKQAKKHYWLSLTAFAAISYLSLRFLFSSSHKSNLFINQASLTNRPPLPPIETLNSNPSIPLTDSKTEPSTPVFSSSQPLSIFTQLFHSHFPNFHLNAISKKAYAGISTLCSLPQPIIFGCAFVSLALYVSCLLKKTPPIKTDNLNPEPSALKEDQNSLNLVPPSFEIVSNIQEIMDTLASSPEKLLAKDGTMKTFSNLSECHCHGDLSRKTTGGHQDMRKKMEDALIKMIQEKFPLPLAKPLRICSVASQKGFQELVFHAKLIKLGYPVDWVLIDPIYYNNQDPGNHPTISQFNQLTKSMSPLTKIETAKYGKDFFKSPRNEADIYLAIDTDLMGTINPVSPEELERDMQFKTCIKKAKQPSLKGTFFLTGIEELNLLIRSRQNPRIYGFLDKDKDKDKARGFLRYFDGQQTHNKDPSLESWLN